MLSASCHYGLQAMLYIACHSEHNKNVDLKSIVSAQLIPSHYLSKILQLLVRQKLLVSMKGPTGGYQLAREADSIQLLDVIEAIDGLDAFKKCGIFNGSCNKENPCSIHNEFRKSMNDIKLLYKSRKLDTYKSMINGCDCLKLKTI
jgi:Rrf2 family protein